MTPAQQRRLRRQALTREKRAERLEASARRYLREANQHRRAAGKLRQKANGQLPLPLTAAETTPDRAPPSRSPGVYRLRTERIRQLLAENHLSHAAVATQLGIAKSTWSQAFNRHRKLSAGMRALIREHPVLGAQPEAELWDVEA